MAWMNVGARLIMEVAEELRVILGFVARLLLCLIFVLVRAPVCTT